MDIQNALKLITALTPDFQALIWPSVIVFILLYLRIPLKKFLGNMSEFTLKAGTSGLEASAKQQEVKVAAEASAALGAASVSKSEKGQENKQVIDDENAKEIAKVVSQAVKPRIARHLAEASVLWVDDNPSNNTFERIALEALGIHTTTSTSTEDALEKLRLNKYQVIVSDMSRPPDLQAGYTLLEELKKRQIASDFIIYDVSYSPDQRTEARRNGAFGSTNNPQELFQLVTSAIESQQLSALLLVGEPGAGRSWLLANLYPARIQAFKAEDAVQKWLMKNYPHSKRTDLSGAFRVDFIIEEQDGTLIGVEVLFRSNSKFPIKDITDRYNLLEKRFYGQKLDKLIIIVVTTDVFKAAEIAERIKRIDLPPGISLIIGQLENGEFVPASEFDTPSNA